MSKCCTLFFLLSLIRLSAQETIFLGAGNAENITVTSSSEFAREYWNEVASAEKTIQGDGLDAEKLDASRFLAQATLGPNIQLIDEVVAMGMEAWIDRQFEEEPLNMLEEIFSVHDEVVSWHYANGGDSADVSNGPSWLHFNYAWWQYNVNNADLLRQRVATALTEIFVISVRSELEGYGEGLAS